MKIAVCIKQILDPEIPAQDFKIDQESRRPAEGQGKMVISIFDENALETAVQLKEKYGGTVTAICMGPKGADQALRRALAMTIDEAIRLDAPADRDAPAVAAVLAAVLKNIGPVDLVLVGRQAGDWDRGQVGPMLAEAMGSTCVTAAFQPELLDGQLLIRREVSGGIDLVAVRLPAVVAITNHDSNVPRFVKVKDTLTAMRKPIRVIQVEVDDEEPSIVLEELTLLHYEANCELIGGEDGPAKAGALVGRMRDLKVL